MRTVALKFLCREITRGTAPTYADGNSGSALVIGQSCVRPDGALVVSRARHHVGAVPSKGRLRGGEVLINSTGSGTLGRVGLVRALPGDGKPVFADGHITVLRPDPRRASGRFLAYGLGLPNSRAYIEQALSAGATKQQELNLGALRLHKVPTADVEWQRAIASILDRECARVDELSWAVIEQHRSSVAAFWEQMAPVLLDGGPRVRLKYLIDRPRNGAWGTSPAVERSIARAFG